MKILRACGEHGRYGDHWNWCNQDEAVGAFGLVCCSSRTCGCNRSFTGSQSNKAATLAKVCEASPRDFAEILAASARAQEAAWPGDVFASRRDDIARGLWLLSEELEPFAVGDVLKISKPADGAAQLQRVVNSEAEICHHR